MSKWREVRFKDVIEFNPKVKLEKNKEYPFIGIADIDESKFYVSENEKLNYVGQSSSKFMSGDILFSRITPCLENRKIARIFLDSEEKGFGSTELFVFRGIKDITLTSYVGYLVKTDIVVLPAINSMTGASGRQRADRYFIEKLKIKIPDLETQEKIAHVLSTYDELIENNNRRIELLENMAEEIYKEWFVRMRFPGHEEVSFEKGIPEGWEVKRVKDVVDRLKAGHYYKEHEVSEVGDTIVIDQSEKTFLGFHSNDPDHIADIDSPIILFGDHSCKMNLMIRNFSVSENVVPFKSVEKNNEIFLFYATKRLVETQEYKRHWTEFTNKKIFIPSDILKSKFINNVRDIIIQVEKYKEQNQNLIKQRDMLLPRLMNGTIEVK